MKTVFMAVSQPYKDCTLIWLTVMKGNVNWRRRPFSVYNLLLLHFNNISVHLFNLKVSMSKQFIYLYFFFFSCCRLRQVQSLLRDGGPTTPDGILCSLGMKSWKLYLWLLLEYLAWYIYCEYLPSEAVENKIENTLKIVCVCVVFQELTADIMKAALSLPNICFMDYMEEISWIWNICSRNFQRRC